MHQTIKTIYRLCFASVIFLVTLSLLLTCFSKTYAILQANQDYAERQRIHLSSDSQQQFVLLSDNKKSNQALYILLAGQGYLSKMNCQHYPTLCTEEYNQSHTRQIQTADLVKTGNFSYLENIQFRDSRTGQSSQLHVTEQQIAQFYKDDLSNLKYSVFAIALFACAALFVSFKLIRNFRRFLTK